MMSYYFNGHEDEGFFDILTGRPRYPISLYNVIRQEEVRKRKGRFPKSKAFISYLLKPEGATYQVPEHLRVLKEAQKEKRYSKYTYPGII